MPQKRNADPMELARGKSGRLIGALTGLLATLKGLPSGYNKDLQEDKEAIFDGVDTLKTLVPVLTLVIETLKINTEKMRQGLESELLATDIAEYLVDKGLPFRQAHHIVGRLVVICSERQCRFDEISLSDYQQESALFEQDVYEWLDFDRSLSRRAVDGGTAPVAVDKQIKQGQDWLIGFSKR